MFVDLVTLKQTSDVDTLTWKILVTFQNVHMSRFKNHIQYLDYILYCLLKSVWILFIGMNVPWTCYWSPEVWDHRTRQFCESSFGRDLTRSAVQQFKSLLCSTKNMHEICFATGLQLNQTELAESHETWKRKRECKKCWISKMKNHKWSLTSMLH